MISKTNLSNIHFFCFFLFVCLFCFCSNSPDRQAGNGDTEPPIHAEQITYRNQIFDIVKIDLRKTDLEFFLAASKEGWKNNANQKLRSLKNLKTYVEANGKELLFAMNAGMYQRDGNPQGLYIENKKVIEPLDTLQVGYGNFYLQPNGVFFIEENKTAGIVPSTIFSKKNIQAKWATQSGPMLLIDNKVHPVFKEGSTNLNIRNGVGIISKHEMVFAISHEEVNLFDFAMLFKEKLNCQSALYLDGFVSRAYIPALKRFDWDGNFGVMIGIWR